LIKESTMNTALVFPGQGAQAIGMGVDLAAGWPAAKAVLAEADAALGFALSKVIAQGPEAELTRTDISQPAILTVSWMAYRVLEAELGAAPRCAAVGGLSLGEYTALVAAGVIGFADAVRLVRLRGQAMQAAADAVPGGMVALIGVELAAAEALCAAVREGEVLTVANLNAPGQVVISGSAPACARAVAAAKDHGIKRALPLPVAGAFHSPLMAPAAARLATAIAGTRFAEPRIPVYHNVDGRSGADAARIKGLLLEQLTGTVRWADCVEGMRAAGIRRYVELGPGSTLSGMIKRIDREADTANLAVAGDVAALVAKFRD
jgi:[acyl-carrier-protein] S-malonyltransferase